MCVWDRVITLPKYDTCLETEFSIYNFKCNFKLMLKNNGYFWAIFSRTYGNANLTGIPFSEIEILIRSVFPCWSEDFGVIEGPKSLIGPSAGPSNHAQPLHGIWPIQTEHRVETD